MINQLRVKNKVLEVSSMKKKAKLSSFQLIIIGFTSVILLGCFMLMLPIATSNGRGASFQDALFTATSATCVTGLIVQDTATYWSAFGQAVILVLIQIGGLGVVTIALFMSIISGKKIGLLQRNTMKESISAPNVGGIVRMTGFILKVTVIIEIIGAVLMMPVFCKDFGVKGVWYSFFHSISSFCNAGFDLMGIREPFSSVMSYSNNILINIVIMLLVILGGIGFVTWNDVKSYGINIKRYRMQSKVVLVTSLLLILLPAIFFFFFEFSREQWDDMSVGDKILASLFQSVTTRTAGYNTVDLTKLSGSSQALMIILMLVGGSPGSTAGGMKTTTFALLVTSTLAVLKRRENAHAFGRRISDEKIKQACAVLVMYIILFLSSGIIISGIENLPTSVAMFETASAIGTVGLTLGVTPQLSIFSKIILMVLMFIGRVGGFTLIYAAISTSKGKISQLPQENITVG